MNYNNYTMNNNDDNDNTMNNNSNDSSSILLAEAALKTPAQKRQPATSSALYRLAAHNLRKYHLVPSMTALKLEKTVALLGLTPRHIVVQGLAPRRLLKGGKGGSSPLVLAGDSLQEGQDELHEAATGELMMDESLINNSSSSEDLLKVEEEEEEDSNSSYDDNGDNISNYSGDDAKGDAEGFEADGNGNGKIRRPIHAALVGAGINLRPRETRPLLRALGVSPHRLVKLGLVKREAGGGPNQHVRAGGPRKVVMGGPRDPPRHAHGPPRGPPHAHGDGPSPGGGPSRSGPMNGPLYSRPFHGAGLRTMHRDGGSEEEGMSAPLCRLGGPAPLGPHGGPGHRGPRHQVSRLQRSPHGPGHHSMPTGRHGRAPPGAGKHEQAGRGPPGSGKHGHGHAPPPHGYGHGHGHGGGGLHGEGLEKGDRLLHGGARGPGQHGPRRYGGGGMGGSRDRPQGPRHGPFHGLFHEGASGTPPGMMTHVPHGSSSRGGGGMKQRGGRHGGGTGFCGRQCGGCGGGGGGGGDLLQANGASGPLRRSSPAAAGGVDY